MKVGQAMEQTRTVHEQLRCRSPELVYNKRRRNARRPRGRPPSTRGGTAPSQSRDEAGTPRRPAGPACRGFGESVLQAAHAWSVRLSERLRWVFRLFLCQMTRNEAFSSLRKQQLTHPPRSLGVLAPHKVRCPLRCPRASVAQ